MPSYDSSRLKCHLGYVIFLAALSWSALVLGRAVAVQAVALFPEMQTAAGNVPSRVDRFLQYEVAARQAPQKPVPQIIIAYSAPVVSAPVLAAAIDTAEAHAGSAPRSKRKSALRIAKADLRKQGRTPAGKLPEFVVMGEIMTVQASAKTSRLRSASRLAEFESTRDITNRNLGIVASLN